MKRGLLCLKLSHTDIGHLWLLINCARKEYILFEVLGTVTKITFDSGHRDIFCCGLRLVEMSCTATDSSSVILSSQRYEVQV